MRNRLSKILASAGVASRRACEEIIFSGRVSVNGKITLLPQTQVDPEVDEIRIDGEVVGRRERMVAFMLNKPKGLLCTNAPGPPRVIDLFKELPYRLFTAGRLDKETTGLLIVTNDGHLAQRIIHPSSNIEKEYWATVAEEVTQGHLQALSRGCQVEGTPVRPLRVEKRGNQLRITVGEGKKREVRVMLESAGLTCLALCRVRIGGLTLGELPVGSYKPLSPADQNKIFS
ncbi:MAG: pseudouridine synthase [Parachlamydiales bacterium]